MKIKQKFQVSGKFLLLALILLIAGGISAEAKGRKYGLFVGINEYQEPISPLFGCVNDARNMRNTMITKFGFTRADTTLLTNAQATRDGIISKIKAYEKLAGEGDLFVFHYSGHGTLFPDSYSEELDETEMQYVEIMENGRSAVIFPRGTYDSAIVPIDADSRTSGKPWSNLILDDELYDLFSAFTKKGAQVVFISDSCHSGSIARNAKSSIPARFTPLHKALRAKSFDELDLKKPKKSEKVNEPPQMNNLYIALTGSKDNEFSLDGGGGGQRMGLFTSTLLKTLNTKGATRWTYKKLIEEVSPKVSTVALQLENDQNPQLDTRFGNGDMVIFSVPKPAGEAAAKSK